MIPGLFRCAVVVFVAVTGVFGGSTSAQTPADISGHWAGEIKLPNGPMPIDLDFSRSGEGGWSGDISIPAQQARDLPLADIRNDGNDFGWRMPGVPGDPMFRGTLSDDGQSLSGSFNQSGQIFPFEVRRAATPAVGAQKALEGFEAFVEQARADWKAPGVAVAIIVGDDVVLARGFGERDVEKKKPVTTKTLFAIGSCTKAFTTFVMASLVADGLLDWDKRVTDYLPSFQMRDEAAGKGMTPRDLVTHRAGLPRHDLVWYNSRLTLEQLVARLAYLEPNKDFRALWQYNNLMFGAAGYLIEKITGKTWPESVKSRVFEPLGMTSSNCSVADSQKSKDFALPYEERDDKLRRMDFRDITHVGPAGSINSCIDDLIPWVKVHLNDGRLGGREILNPRLMTDLHAPQMIMPERTDDTDIVAIGYGMAWVADSYRGHLRVHHGGNIDGFSALITLLPRERIGIVVLTNMNGSGLPGIITRHAIDRLLNLEPKDWHGEAMAKRAKGKEMQKEAEKKKDLVRRSGTKPAHALEEYAGDYENPGYGILKIALRGGRLEMTYNYITNALEHWHYDVFACAKNEQDHTFEDLKVLFQTDMAGEVATVQVPFEPSVKDIVFTRRPDSKLSDPKFLDLLVGEYELGPQLVRISRKGSGLTAFIPGQPVYNLAPRRANTFELEGMSGFSMKFILDDGGPAQEIQINQPNGVFTARRKGETPTSKPGRPPTSAPRVPATMPS